MKTCRQCKNILKPPQKYFCSVKCKGLSQRKRIRIVCSGCGKEFFILPYLKRVTNYCSLDCYWGSTNKKKTRICKTCGKQFPVKFYLTKQGLGLYCSKNCLHQTYPKQAKLNCLNCGKQISVPPSKSKLVKYCSKICHDDFMRDYVEKTCKNCHRKFQLPRWELNKGRGGFCSRECYIEFKGETSIEKKIRLALDSARILFSQEKKIGVYRADFVILGKNIIIECDGDYWHKIPGAIEKDQRKDRYLNHLGYKVIRIAENHIRQLSSDQLIKEISSKIN
ncbi:MAG: DUF559 domain-containing protein [Patescibacteria group bacterium]|nr:DUF559 domain-containing protein [Patescibacteria group bacterium]